MSKDGCRKPGAEQVLEAQQFREQGNTGEAIRLLELAMGVNNSAAAALLGELFVETGETDRAITAYQRAIALGEPDAAFNLGSLLDDLGDVSAAE